MKLKIEIRMDNAAFEHAATREVERIFATLIERLADAPDHGLERGEIPLRDFNGNLVGEAKVMR